MTQGIMMISTNHIQKQMWAMTKLHLQKSTKNCIIIQAISDDKKKMESMHKEVKFFKNIGFFENG